MRVKRLKGGFVVTEAALEAGGQAVASRWLSCERRIEAGSSGSIYLP